MPKAPKQVLSHWYHLEDEFTTSAQAFYEGIEEAVRARELPEVAFERVTFKEGGVLSAKREYLRVKRGRIAFDVGAAPYGRGYFFSWWLVEIPGDPFVHLARLFILGVGFVLGSVVLWNLLEGCGGLIIGALLIFIGIPLALLLLGRMVQEGAFPGVTEEEVLGIPILGWLYELVFQPSTYYRLDTALMFQESIRRALGEVLGETLSGQGKRVLTPEELAPRMRILR